MLAWHDLLTHDDVSNVLVFVQANHGLMDHEGVMLFDCHQVAIKSSSTTFVGAMKALCDNIALHQGLCAACHWVIKRIGGIRLVLHAHGRHVCVA